MAVTNIVVTVRVAGVYDLTPIKGNILKGQKNIINIHIFN